MVVSNLPALRWLVLAATLAISGSLLAADKLGDKSSANYNIPLWEEGKVPLEESVDTVMGRFEKGTQGAFWLKVIGKSKGRERVIVDHITRIHASCAVDWPQPDQGVGDHRVFVDGDPQLTIVSRADLPGGTRADGGNTTAANRLLGALNWLAEQKPGIYDGLDVPMQSVLPPEMEATRWSD